MRITIRNVLKEQLGMSIQEFGKQAGIPQSTLYKILNEGREPNLKTLRQILQTIRKLEGRTEGEFIALIATRPALDKTVESYLEVNGQNVAIREYPANTVEEAIIAAVQAEREGARAIVCAPIVSHTIEKIISIPIAVIMPTGSLIHAIELAMKKVM
jgi:predicted transcriptional regulator